MKKKTFLMTVYSSRHYSLLILSLIATVNPNGDSCPYALKSVVVQLLLAITTYLRETHQFLPKYRLPSSSKEMYGDRSSHTDISQEKKVAGDTTYRATSPTQGVELHSPVSDDQDSMESIVGDIGQVNTGMCYIL